MTAVPKAPEPKKINLESPAEERRRKGVTIEVDADKLNWISKIRTFDGDIKSFRSRLKTLQEQAEEIIENTSEHETVTELETQLKVAREDLKRRLQSNSEYNNILEEIAQEKEALKDAETNVSDFLLGYFKDTGERQIELGPKQAREVVLKARLGKEKDYQTNLFVSGGGE